MLKHGKSNTRIYKIWKGIWKRCKDKDNKNYGKKGITVCEEWKDFENFDKWSTENGYEDSLSIDRIDSNGNYCPENCRWADRKTQNRNTSQNKPFKAISPTGEVYYHNVKTEFAEIHGLNVDYIYSCIRGKQKTYKGWRFEKV
jgi:hypothetical protein